MTSGRQHNSQYEEGNYKQLCIRKRKLLLLGEGSGLVVMLRGGASSQ